MLSKLRESEVENLQPTIGCDSQVARLQIAMHNPMLVRRGEARGKLDTKLHDFLLGQPRATQFRVQRRPRNVLRDQKIKIAFAAEFVDGGNTRKVDARQRKRFFAEAAPRTRVGKHARRQHLYGHVALQLLVAGTIHDSHAPSPNLLEDAITRDGLANHADMEKGAICASAFDCCSILAPLGWLTKNLARVSDVYIDRVIGPQSVNTRRCSH